jgi:hypothetical protein
MKRAIKNKNKLLIFDLKIYQDSENHEVKF